MTEEEFQELVALAAALLNVCPICGNPRDKCFCDPGDGLRLCRTCGDRETTNADSICDSCKHQAWLDKNA